MAGNEYLYNARFVEKVLLALLFCSFRNLRQYLFMIQFIVVLFYCVRYFIHSEILRNAL